MTTDVKSIDIRNRTYYFFNDMINLSDFDSSLVKIDKKSYKDINVYFIGYITINKIDDYENIHSVNSLYLIIHSDAGHFKEKNDDKYLTLDLADKYEEIWSEIRSQIKTINGGKELFDQKNYARIGINADDHLPLNKTLKFPTLTIIIRCVFQEGEKLYPQIYLDECLYELLSYV